MSSAAGSHQQSQQQPPQQHQQQQQANNLLSPSAALEQVTPGQQQQQQRRKSTLSGNGFFIDYSCTRRRSSAAVRQPQHQYGGGGGGGYPASPAGAVFGRGPAGSFCAGSQPSSPRSRAHSRSGATSLSPMLAAAGGPAGRRLTVSSMLLVPPLDAPSALAGSRKTSIFDPAGHSLGAAHLRAMRRKSTMVTSMPFVEGCASSANSGGALDASASSSSMAKMLSLAKSASRSGSASGGVGGACSRSRLVRDHVPVIGCSPTSIRASLAALDETRRYEKLLKKLKRHEKSRLKRDKKRQKRQQQQRRQREQSTSDAAGAANSAALSFRRKSLRAIKDAAALLGNNKHQSRASITIDENLSVSSMSLSHAFDQSSIRDDYDNDYGDNYAASSRDPFAGCHQQRSKMRQCSSSVGSFEELDDNNNNFHGRLKNHLSNEDDDDDENVDDHYDDAEDEDDEDDDEDDDDDERYELNNDELFLDDNTMVNLNELLPSCSGNNNNNQHRTHQACESQLVSNEQRTKSANGKSTSSSAQSSTSLVKFAMRRLTGSMKASSSPRRSRRNPAAERSSSQQPNADYWHYYYYLRENSLDAIDDLPISGSGGGGAGSGAVLSDNERRVRLHMNYSLARIEILNDCGAGARSLSSPSAPAQRTATAASGEPISAAAGATQASELGGVHLQDEQQQHLFDQASDVSLSLSTSSSISRTARQAGGAAATNDSESETEENSLADGAERSLVAGSFDDDDDDAAATSSSARGSRLSSFSSHSSLNVNSTNSSQRQWPAGGGDAKSRPWQRQHSMSSQSVAALKSSPGRRGRQLPATGPPLAASRPGQQRERERDRERHRQPSGGGGNLADDESTSFECLMDRNQLSPSPMRPKSADTSTAARQHRSASGELLNSDGAAVPNSAAAAAAKQSRRSASFRIHTSRPRKQQQLIQTTAAAAAEPELDDFERFRRAHRAGYNQNGELDVSKSANLHQPQPQPPAVPSIEAPATTTTTATTTRRQLENRRSGGRGRWSQLNPSVRGSAGGGGGASSSTNRLAQMMPTNSSSSAASTNAGSGHRSSMSWDTLNSTWLDELELQTFQAHQPQQHQQRHQHHQQPAVKRTSSARLSSRPRERPPIGSLSNPTRFNQPQQQSQQQHHQNHQQHRDGQANSDSHANAGGPVRHLTTSGGGGVGEFLRQCNPNDNYSAHQVYASERDNQARRVAPIGQQSRCQPVISHRTMSQASIVNLNLCGGGGGGGDDGRSWQVAAAPSSGPQTQRLAASPSTTSIRIGSLRVAAAAAANNNPNEAAAGAEVGAAVSGEPKTSPPVSTSTGLQMQLQQQPNIGKFSHHNNGGLFSPSSSSFSPASQQRLLSTWDLASA